MKNSYVDTRCVIYPNTNPYIAFDNHASIVPTDLYPGVANKNLKNPPEITKTNIDVTTEILLQEKQALLEWSDKILNSKSQEINNEQSLELVHKQPQELVYDSNNDPSTNHLSCQSLAKSDNHDLGHLYNILLSKYHEVNQQKLSLIDGIEETQGHLDIANATIKRLEEEITCLKEQMASQIGSLESSSKKISTINTQLDEMYRKVDEGEAAKRELEEKLKSANDEIVLIKNSKFMPSIGEGHSEKTYSDAIKQLQSYLEELNLEIKGAFSIEACGLIGNEIKINGHDSLSHLDDISGNCISNHVKIIANAMQRHQELLDDDALKTKHKKQLKYKDMEIKKALRDAEIANAKYRHIKKLYDSRFRFHNLLINHINTYKFMTSVSEISFYVKSFKGLKLNKGYIMLNTQGDVSWGKTDKLKDGAFNVSNIIKIDYGKKSASAALNADKNPADKWRCFGVTFKISSVDYSSINFVAPNGQSMKHWVLGLASMSGIPHGITRGGFFTEMVKMKIESYSEKVGKKINQIWKDAINKTKN